MSAQRLVVGRGLLGNAIGNLAPVVPTPSIPWNEPEKAQTVLFELGRTFGEQRGTERWDVAWCAGVSVVGTPRSRLEDELRALKSLLDGLRTGLAGNTNGALFFASSAGAIYADNVGQSITEASEPAPTADYGAGKLQQEAIVSQFADDSGVPVMLGRISNLYGPRQNMQKPQGFISHLCRSMLLKRPFVLSVPIDTTRDFVHAEDVALRVDAWLGSPASQKGSALVKLLVAGRSTNLAQVISMTSNVTGVRPRVVVARNAASHLQPRHLRFVSGALRAIDETFPSRSLERGIAEAWQHALLAHASGDPG